MLNTLLKIHKRRRKALEYGRVSYSTFLKNFCHPKFKIVSFDIFDTVVFRRSGAPESIFDLMGFQLSFLDFYRDFPAELRTQFRHHRVLAERAVVMRLKPEGAGLLDIYDHLARDFHLETWQKEALINLEINQEMENLTAVTEIKNLLPMIRERGQKVIFVSDMYLSRTILKDILTKNEILAKNERIYVSCEYLKTKREGGLYDIVLQEENCSPENIIHLGDNFYTDVHMGRTRRIACFHYLKTGFN
ncbi:MAG: hypothetical protein EOM23_06025, partial [Candidatus Moranbacteria bacterium]|nr:hypothetical protein [Candidatus Moranbacteria bacterium]